MTTDTFDFHAISPESRERLYRDVRHYSVGLICMKLDNGGVSHMPVGSGTLVECGGRYGILTADHVVASPQFSQMQALGFNIANYQHSFYLNDSELQVHRIAKYSEKLVGPDLAFVELLSNKLETLSSKCSFWNLDKHVEIFENGGLDGDDGIWILIGMPQEYELGYVPDDQVRPDFQKVTGHTLLTCCTAPIRESEDGNYDYIFSSVSYEPPLDPPETFKGMSGGGIWKSRATRDSNGEVQLGRAYLCGVIIREKYLPPDYKIVSEVEGHGRKSIYRNVRNYLIGKPDSR